MWPIKTRIDMLATGIKTPVGVKIAGPDLEVIQQIGQEVEAVLKEVPGTASAFSERVAGGRYVTVDIRRDQASRYGLNIDDVQDVVRTAIGGMNVTETVEGLERYPVNLRYPQGVRDSLEKLKELAVVTPHGQQIPLSAVADIAVEDGPPMIKSENARLNGWIFVDIEGVDLGSYVAAAKQAVAEQVELPAGYSIELVRAVRVHGAGQGAPGRGRSDHAGHDRPAAVSQFPATWPEVLIILGTLPTALIGGVLAAVPA